MIYVVIGCADYESSTFLGIYTTIDKAKQVAKDNFKCGFDDFDIFEVMPDHDEWILKENIKSH